MQSAGQVTPGVRWSEVSRQVNVVKLLLLDQTPFVLIPISDHAFDIRCPDGAG